MRLLDVDSTLLQRWQEVVQGELETRLGLLLVLELVRHPDLAVLHGVVRDVRDELLARQAYQTQPVEMDTNGQ